MARDPIKILIVDDDEDVLIELERLLEGEGYSTATAWSGQEALALSEKLQFDLLLVDEHLANVDAHALFDELVARQPNAFRFLMHTRKESTDLTAQTAVCKWEHADVMAKIRNCLAA
ncbi:MAG TPA: response regulator [Terriglobales bacterium]|nr:response regulator [Terriglobales bacterium]